MRKKSIEVSWFGVFTFLVLCIGIPIYAISATVKLAALNKQLGIMSVEMVKLKNSNIMVWEMDSSCFNQIKNSNDGIIRLKINK